MPHSPERTRRFRGQTIYVSIHKKPEETRGLSANRYLWKLYGNIAAETGNDPETVHQAMKREAVRVGVLEPQYVLVGNQLFEDDPTTVVEQDAFNKYLEWLKDGCRHGNLVGCRVALPGEE